MPLAPNPPPTMDGSSADSRDKGSSLWRITGPFGAVQLLWSTLVSCLAYLLRPVRFNPTSYGTSSGTVLPLISYRYSPSSSPAQKQQTCLVSSAENLVLVSCHRACVTSHAAMTHHPASLLCIEMIQLIHRKCLLCCLHVSVVVHSRSALYRVRCSRTDCL